MGNFYLKIINGVFAIVDSRDKTVIANFLSEKDAHKFLINVNSANSIKNNKIINQPKMHNPFVVHPTDINYDDETIEEIEYIGLEDNEDMSDISGIEYGFEKPRSIGQISRAINNKKRMLVQNYDYIYPEYPEENDNEYYYEESDYIDDDAYTQQTSRHRAVHGNGLNNSQKKEKINTNNEIIKELKEIKQLKILQQSLKEKIKSKIVEKEEVLNKIENNSHKNNQNIESYNEDKNHDKFVGNHKFNDEFLSENEKFDFEVTGILSDIIPSKKSKEFDNVNDPFNFIDDKELNKKNLVSKKSLIAEQNEVTSISKEDLDDLNDWESELEAEETISKELTITKENENPEQIDHYLKTQDMSSEISKKHSDRKLKFLKKLNKKNNKKHKEHEVALPAQIEKKNNIEESENLIGSYEERLLGYSPQVVSVQPKTPEIKNQEKIEDNNIQELAGAILKNPGLNNADDFSLGEMVNYKKTPISNMDYDLGPDTLKESNWKNIANFEINSNDKDVIDLGPINEDETIFSTPRKDAETEDFEVFNISKKDKKEAIRLRRIEDRKNKKLIIKQKKLKA